MTDSQIKAAFGKSLRTFREAAGISQEALADLAGVNRTYVGDIERGKRNVAVVNMTRLAKALKVPLSEVVREMEKLLGR